MPAVWITVTREHCYTGLIHISHLWVFYLVKGKEVDSVTI